MAILSKSDCLEVIDGRMTSFPFRDWSFSLSIKRRLLHSAMFRRCRWRSSVWRAIVASKSDFTFLYLVFGAQIVILSALEVLKMIATSRLWTLRKERREADLASG